MCVCIFTKLLAYFSPYSANFHEVPYPSVHDSVQIVLFLYYSNLSLWGLLTVRLGVIKTMNLYQVVCIYISNNTRNTEQDCLYLKRVFLTQGTSGIFLQVVDDKGTLLGNRKTSLCPSFLFTEFAA